MSLCNQTTGYIISVKPKSSGCVLCGILVTSAHIAKDGTQQSPELERHFGKGVLALASPTSSLQNTTSNLSHAAGDDGRAEPCPERMEKHTKGVPCKMYNSFQMCGWASKQCVFVRVVPRGSLQDGVLGGWKGKVLVRCIFVVLFLRVNKAFTVVVMDRNLLKFCSTTNSGGVTAKLVVITVCVGGKYH